MRSRWCLALVPVIGVACHGGGGSDGGGGESLDGSRDGVALAANAQLTIVARPGDDLTLLDPVTTDTTVVYVTADGSANAEHDGVRAAYAGGSGAWSCGFITIADHAVEHCRLEAQRVSLVFLGYPAGGDDGSGSNSLLQLWEAHVDSATTLAARPATYDQKGLIAVVAAILTTTQPGAIRTEEVSATHHTDVSDRMLTGALTLLAQAQAGSTAPLLAYRGDNVKMEPANVGPSELAREITAFGAFGSACGAPACGSASDLQVAELGRHYADGFRRPFRGALLYSADLDQCITSTDGASIRVDDCATAMRWQLTAGGALQEADRCIEQLPTGELVLAHCDASAVAPPSERFLVDDEGHLWSGAPPAPADGMDYAHLDCLVAGTMGAKVHAQLCGQDESPSWRVLGGVAATALAVPDGARGAIADFDGDGHGDLAVASGGALMVYRGSGDGTFATTPQAFGALAGDASTLVAGDLDGSGGADACVRGSGAAGVSCLVGGSAVAWTTDALGGALSIANAEVCGMRSAGGSGAVLACDARGAASDGVVLATGGDPALATSGSAAPVGCSFDIGRVTCGGAGGDAVLASYAFGGVTDSASDGTTTGDALGDIDGDGVADACSIDPRARLVECARGQLGGGRFGPQVVVNDAPTNVTGQIAVGDLDGDGHADVCLVAPTGVQCALSP